MAQTFSGNISEMSLLEILKLLHSGKMNGVLRIKNQNHLGEIFLQNGQIVHCVTNSSQGEAAFQNLLGWVEGDFVFGSEAVASERTIHTATEDLLAAGAKMLDDLKSIRKLIPSTDVIFTLAPTSARENLNIRLEEWQILAQINGSRTVREIVEITGKDEYSVAKTLYNLFSQGLLDSIRQVEPVKSAMVPEDFFVKIETELTHAIGPMAPIIIEETLDEFHEHRDAFPVDRIAVLIEKVSGEISDENKKLRFYQSMIESLKTF